MLACAVEEKIMQVHDYESIKPKVIVTLMNHVYFDPPYIKTYVNNLIQINQ